jgi:DNA-binding NtrC family response regulator
MMTKFLILDDDDNYRCYLDNFLREYFQASVYTAKDNQQAYAVLNKTIIDIYLIDIIRKGSMCLEFIKTVRSIQDYSHSPMMIIADTSCENIKAECLRQEVTGFFKKPLDLENFMLAINASIACQLGSCT